VFGHQGNHPLTSEAAAAAAAAAFPAAASGCVAVAAYEWLDFLFAVAAAVIAAAYLRLLQVQADAWPYLVLLVCCAAYYCCPWHSSRQSVPHVWLPASAALSQCEILGKDPNLQFDF